MKLYDLPRQSLFKWPGDAKTPPAHGDLEPGTVVRFVKIDGAYSLCVVHDGPHKGEIVHLAAWAEAEPVPHITVHDGNGNIPTRLTKPEYDALCASGMMWEFHPDAPLRWPL